MKGREDALFVSLLMSRVLTEMDLSDDEDEDDKCDRGVEPDAPSQLMQCVVRTVTPRPGGPENYDTDWLDSMNRKMAAMQRTDECDDLVCHYCGLSERVLASCFVKVENRREWEKSLVTNGLKVNSF